MPPMFELCQIQLSKNPGEVKIIIRRPETFEKCSLSLDFRYVRILILTRLDLKRNRPFFKCVRIRLDICAVDW